VAWGTLVVAVRAANTALKVDRHQPLADGEREALVAYKAERPGATAGSGSAAKPRAVAASHALAHPGATAYMAAYGVKFLNKRAGRPLTPARDGASGGGTPQGPVRVGAVALTTKEGWEAYRAWVRAGKPATAAAAEQAVAAAPKRTLLVVPASLTAEGAKALYVVTGTRPRLRGTPDRAATAGPGAPGAPARTPATASRLPTSPRAPRAPRAPKSPAGPNAS